MANIEDQCDAVPVNDFGFGLHYAEQAAASVASLTHHEGCSREAPACLQIQKNQAQQALPKTQRRCQRNTSYLGGRFDRLLQPIPWNCADRRKYATKKNRYVWV